jgi:16S rRNA (adenine1518-N6/adenine1519-N6)-dimethyltransferase
VVTARKRFGQHFLEPAWVAKLVTAIAPQATDAIVEIGPGRGAITWPLVERAARVLAIEVDRDLAAALRARQDQRLTVVEADVLEADLATLVLEWFGQPLGPNQPVRVVGNLPYNISTPILFQLLYVAASTGGITDASLMLQREVADRLRAGPGSREYGVLSILTSLHADVVPVLSLPPGAFRPPPKVFSAVVQLRFRPRAVGLQDEALFTQMVRSVFTQRRKTMRNALTPFGKLRGLPAEVALAEAGLDGRRRPETLHLVDLARLADVFASSQRPAVL